MLMMLIADTCVCRWRSCQCHWGDTQPGDLPAPYTPDHLIRRFVFITTKKISSTKADKISLRPQWDLDSTGWKERRPGLAMSGAQSLEAGSCCCFKILSFLWLFFWCIFHYSCCFFPCIFYCFYCFCCWLVAIEKEINNDFLINKKYLSDVSIAKV